MTNLHFMCAAQLSDERELSARESSVVVRVNINLNPMSDSCPWSYVSTE